MEVAIPPIPPEGPRPSTVGSRGSSRGSSVPSSVFASPPSPRSSSARGGRRLKSLGGSPPDAKLSFSSSTTPRRSTFTPRGSSRGSSRGSPRRQRLPGLGLSSSSTELRWLAKVTPQTAADLINAHVTCQHELNSLALAKAQRLAKLEAMKSELMAMHKAQRKDAAQTTSQTAIVAALRRKLSKVLKQQKGAVGETGKLRVMLKRTKTEWVAGMARMQDIGDYQTEQLQAIWRGSQWRMYNELLREVSAFKLTGMHHQTKESTLEYGTLLKGRKKEMGVLEELNVLMSRSRADADDVLADEHNKGVEKLGEKAVQQQSKATIKELQRALDITSKVEKALVKLQKHGHRIEDIPEKGRTGLDVLLDALQQTQLMQKQAEESRRKGLARRDALLAEHERLTDQLQQTQFPTVEVEEEDTVMDETNIFKEFQQKERSALKRQREVNIFLPQMETTAQGVVTWMSRVQPKLEGFETYQQAVSAHIAASGVSYAEDEPLPPEVAVERLLHGMEALLRWIKAEVSAAQPSMDWSKFYAEGLAGTEEGKVHCVDSATNTRIYTEEEVASQLLEARHKQIEKEHKTASGLNIPLEKQMGAMGKLEEIQRQQKEEQVQVEIQAEIEFEAQLDAMNEDEANAYARDSVASFHAEHRGSARSSTGASQSAERSSRRR